MTVMTNVDLCKASMGGAPVESVPEPSVVCEIHDCPREIFVVNQIAVARNTLSSPKTLKCLIAAVLAGLILVVLVIAGVLGLYLLLERTHTVQYQLEVKLSEKSSLKQETTHFVSDDVVEQHVVADNGSSDVWILSDFSRNIQIIRMQQDDSSSITCYVTPLNRTSSVSMPPSSSSDSSDNLVSGTVMQPTSMPSVRFVPSSFPIKDTSILGTRGQKLCADAPTFWAWPSYTSEDQQVNISTMTVTSPGAPAGSRVKRQAVDWCWALQCFNMVIGSYYTQPRTYVCCNRQYRCPCSVATDIASTTATPTTTVAAIALLLDGSVVNVKKNAITY